MRNILNKIKFALVANWQFWTVLVLAVFFGLATAGFLYKYQDKDLVKWGAPDENANYTFARLYSQNSDLRLFESYNAEAGDIMRPRSFRSDEGFLKPVSFLGMILLYGQSAAWFGWRLLPYFTPVLASLGLIFYYLLLKKIFDQRQALLATLLLASFPVYAYYTARSMFHNVPFVVFVIIFLYFSVLLGEKKRVCSSSLVSLAAGGFFGLAVMTRTSELLWLGPLVVFLGLANWRRLSFLKVALFLSAAFLVLLPAFHWNQALYGAPWSGGYGEMNQAIKSIGAQTGELAKSTAQFKPDRWLSAVKQIKSLVFRFGYQPNKSLDAFYFYFIKMFWWLFWPAVFGLGIFLGQEKMEKRQKLFLTGWLGLSWFLAVYYGSWDFHDNPDPSSKTIGNSYTRYWLPIYLGALPWAAVFLDRLVSFFVNFASNNLNQRRFWFKIRNLVVVLILSLVLGAATYKNIIFLWRGSEEGLAFWAKKMVADVSEVKNVLAETPSNSVIITIYHDKLFFPERKVVVGDFSNSKMNEYYSVLAKKLPVYYYNFSLKQIDLDYLNQNRLAVAGLRIELEKKMNDKFSLYRISLKK